MENENLIKEPAAIPEPSILTRARMVTELCPGVYKILEDITNYLQTHISPPCGRLWMLTQERQRIRTEADKAAAAKGGRDDEYLKLLDELNGLDIEGRALATIWEKLLLERKRLQSLIKITEPEPSLVDPAALRGR